MKIEIKPGAPVGETAAPPSKSYGHRMLICAALAEYCAGTREAQDAITSVHGIDKDSGISEDILATEDCIRALLTVHDTGILPVLPCRESGSTLRFFIPIAMVLAGGGVFTGSERLMQRGIEVYEELFAAQSQSQAEKQRCQAPLRKIEECNDFLTVPDTIRVTKKSDRITVEGRLMPGEMTVRGDVSSQFISGLLYALPLLDGDSILHVTQPIESRLYIDITIDEMKSFGVVVEEPVPGTFRIPGGQCYEPGDKTIEGDWSNAAFLYAMKYLHENCTSGANYAAECDGTLCTGAAEGRDADAASGSLQIRGLNPDSLQGDKICLEYFHRLDSNAQLYTAASEWDGYDEHKSAICTGDGTDACREAGGAAIDMPPIDLTNCPDLGPVLFAYAAARGGGRFTGVRRLRIKESDRIACMQEELAKFGIKTGSGEDELVIYPGKLQVPSEVLNGHNDHRIVMALAVLCTLTGGVIDGAEAVRKSWPDFWKTLDEIGITTMEV